MEKDNEDSGRNLDQSCARINDPSMHVRKTRYVLVQYTIVCKVWSRKKVSMLRPRKASLLKGLGFFFDL